MENIIGEAEPHLDEIGEESLVDGQEKGNHMRVMQDIDYKKFEKLMYMGLTFDSEEEAFEKYNDYAGRVGFSVRKDKTYKRADGTVRSRILVCCKEGERKKNPDYEHVRKERKETRTGCKARVIVKNDGKEWIVQEIEHKHNHYLTTPSEAYLLKSQRNIEEPQGAEINNLEAAGIQPIDGYRFLSQQAGGTENVGLTYTDYKNFLRKKREEEYAKGDANVMMNYFIRKKEENPAFFYAVMFDEEHQITNIFWADALSVIDYKYFGDVVVFDTTYRTNMYGRPFAPFVGVNHHLQTIIFGGALLIDETTESFVWLFETWMKAMSEKSPKTILTDQCAAMAKAISIVFPETRHRLCLWHIYQNAAKHLSHVYKLKGFQTDFNQCIYNCETEDIFLERWNKMLHEYDLLENDWLKELFKIKEKWALVYGRDTFCADMTTTQRGESTNALLKKFVKRKYNLTQFITRYESLLQSRRQAELELDFESTQASQKLFVSTPMMKQASNIYTHVAFGLFEVEYKDILKCRIEVRNLDGRIYTYAVARGKWPRTVIFDSCNSQIHCSCRRFEFVGILCCHILKVFYHHNIFEIPEQYLMRRWTKEVKAGVARDKDGKPILPDCNAGLSLRYNELCQMAIKFVTKGAVNEEAYSVAKLALDNALKEVEAVIKVKHNSPTDCSINNDNPKHTHNLVEETFTIARGSEKGRPTGTRPKSGLEVSQKKKRGRAVEVIETEGSVHQIHSQEVSSRVNTEQQTMNTNRDCVNESTNILGQISHNAPHTQGLGFAQFGRMASNLHNASNVSFNQLLQQVNQAGPQQSANIYSYLPFGSRGALPLQVPQYQARPQQLPNIYSQPHFGSREHMPIKVSQTIMDFSFGESLLSPRQSLNFDDGGQKERQL